MAEIEHFCDPTDKSHPKFSEVRDVQVSYRIFFQFLACEIIQLYYIGTLVFRL